MSNKQKTLGALINHGFVHLRCQFYATTRERITSCFVFPARWRYNQDLANLLHRLGETVHTPDFTATDISLLNHAIPAFLARARNRWDTRLLDLFVQLHDCVPSDLAGRITWHPTESMRAGFAARRSQQHALADSVFPEISD